MSARAFVTAALGATMVACAQPQPAENSAASTAGGDSSPRFIGVIGAKAQHAPPFLGVSETNFYCLRSFVDRKTGETRHQVYVSDSYTGPERHWDAARDGAGRPLRVLEISRVKIGCDGECSYAEEFTANIPESELTTDPHGLSVTFIAASGAEKTILVSASQIAAQLAAVDAQRGKTPTASYK
jgi:hypothetical protein